MKPPSSMNALIQGCVLAAAMSTANGAEPQRPPPAQSESNSIGFIASDGDGVGVLQGFGSGSQHMADMRAQLEDPQQRAKFRENLRKGIADSHYGVADALELDAAEFDRLIEVLTDQQMEQSDSFYREFATQAPTGDPANRMKVQAERSTRHIAALRKVLGREKFERYRTIQSSLGQRYYLRQLDARLAESDKLNSTQHERLAELLHEQMTISIERMRPRNFGRSTLFNQLNALRTLPSQEELQRQSLLDTIADSETTWREQPESNRQVRERAAEFLTERQMAALTQMQDEQLASQQQRIEQMRVEAGLDPTIPEQPEAGEVPPATVDRDLKLSFKVAVNNESPRYLTTVVSSGKSVSLKISRDLSLEVTPIVFEDDNYNLRVEYYETADGAKRPIGSMGVGGMVKPAGPDPRSPQIGAGGSGMVLTGRKGYAVELSVLVEAT
jgi:hypothetical protein